LAPILPAAPGRFSMTNCWQPLGEPLTYQAPDDVEATPGGEADYDAHRLARIGLGHRDARDGRERCSARC